MAEIKIGIIGGTGLDYTKVIERATEKRVSTEYGAPSGPLLCGYIGDTKCVFLLSHGPRQSIAPSNINYRANICALKNDGCTHVISTSACGSLKEEIQPGDFVIIDQFIDRTCKRDLTFYDQKVGSWKGVCHMQMSEPFCPHVRRSLIQACKVNDATYHAFGTVVTIEGPRFSTQAETRLHISWGADLVNMTSVPEATLAKEAGIMYASLAMATNFDCWKQSEEPVNLETAGATFKRKCDDVVKILRSAVGLISEKKNWLPEICEAKEHVKKAMKHSE